LPSSNPSSVRKRSFARGQIGVLAFEWELFLEREKHALKDLPVHKGVGSITLEVKIQAAAAQLGAEIAKSQALSALDCGPSTSRTAASRHADRTVHLDGCVEVEAA
jgi:hypothetical protein